MSRAEELARKYVLPMLDNHYAKYGENKQMQLSRFDGLDIVSSYEEGYHQAEKDLELTWEDIRNICRMWIESKTPFGVTGEALSIEVLKRFKAQKGK